MLSHAQFLVGQSQHLSAVSHMQGKEENPGWILLPGTQTTTQKACSDSWKSTQKAEFQPAQLPKLAHSQHCESPPRRSAQVWSNTFIPAQLQQQNPLGPHGLYLWMEPAPLQEALWAQPLTANSFCWSQSLNHCRRIQLPQCPRRRHPANARWFSTRRGLTHILPSPQWKSTGSGEKRLETGIVLSSSANLHYLQRPGKVWGEKQK